MVHKGTSHLTAYWADYCNDVSAWGLISQTLHLGRKLPIPWKESGKTTRVIQVLGS